MAGFFLHLCNGDGCVEDEQGHEFADLAAARIGALNSLRAVLAEEVNEGLLYVSSFIEIEDADRVHVATVGFSDAIEISERIARQPRPL